MIVILNILNHKNDKKMFKYIYILDYSYGGLLEIKLEPDDAEYLEEDDYNTIEDILEEYGVRGKDCSYMLSENKLELETIEKLKK